MSWLSYFGLFCLAVGYLLSDDKKEWFSMILELLAIGIIAIGILLLWERFA